MSDGTADLIDRLNDGAVKRRCDPLGMLELVMSFAAQCSAADSIGREFGRGWQIAEIRNVVLTGMGGSGIGGEFARALIDEHGSVPLAVNRDYAVPAWVGHHTLVVAASYSGNTEETLAAYLDAKSKGASLAVITSGGELAVLARKDGAPLAVVPGGQPPRSATGYMFLPLMHLLIRLGLLSRKLESQVGETIDLMDQMSGRLGPAVPELHNPAKKLARALQGKIPIIYGSRGVRGAVAARWKGQFNENAKQAAFANALPEQNHVEALAWVRARSQAANWAVILLRDSLPSEESVRIARRVELTKELIGADTEVHDVWAEGESTLARMFSLIYFADFVTVYLAILNGICPTEMKSLEFLKRELARMG